ncbi:MAG: hypothetical protein HY720_24600 [Planctomycetes bacterium]|nr:hypothetical protein [Planctomycetota bacterium]
MKAHDIRQKLAEKPFLPIEMRTSDGRVYWITTPEVLVSDTSTVILDQGSFRMVDNDNIVSFVTLRPERQVRRRVRSR